MDVAGCHCSVLWLGAHFFFTLITQKLFFAIWGLCWCNFFYKEVKVKKQFGQFFTTGILHKFKSKLGAIIIQESMRRENVLMNCQSDQVFEDSNQQTIQATSATSAERKWLAVRIWIEGFNMHVAPEKVALPPLGSNIQSNLG